MDPLAPFRPGILAGYRLLQFRQLWLPDRGRFVDVGMPATPAGFTRGVFYLFENAADAKTGSHAGGTGFIVNVPSKLHPSLVGYKYAVTNWHVAVKGGCPVMRFNRKDGGEPVIVERDCAEWEFIPGGPDLAATFLT